MGWETRTTPNGRTHGPYYVRKTRDAEGRVRSTYVGRGAFAHELARFEELAAETEALQRAHVRARLAPLDAALDALRLDAARLRTWRDAYLVATGHRSHRGQWRRLRGRHAAGSPFAEPFLLTAPDAGADPMARKTSTPKKATEPMRVGGTLGIGGAASFTVPDAPEALRRRLAEALDAGESARATDGNTLGATQTLRGVLSEFSAEAFGPFLAPAACDAVASVFGTQPVAAALAACEAERFAEALREPTDGPLVAAAVSHAALAYLVSQTVATQYGTTIAGRGSLALMQGVEKRMTAAQTRYLRALATVAALRRAEGDERERAARLDAAADERRLGGARTLGQLSGHLLPPVDVEALDARRVFAPPPADDVRVSGDSLPSPADMELVACAVG